MAGPDYVAPESAEAAAKALAAGGPAAWALAGGTDLIVQLRSGRVKPGMIVDIKRVPGVMGVRRDGESFVIGAATPGAMLGEHEALGAAWPGVVEAATLIGSTQVQGRASMGGNLCNASPAADSVPALVAARATCVIVGPGGRREAPAEAIATGPGQTSLAAGEFVLEIRLPPPPPRSADAFGAGVNLTVDAGGVITDARIALGAVAPTVVLADPASVIGARLDEAALQRLDAAARAVCRPIDDKRGTAEFRTKIAGVLARRAATIAYKRALKA